jgi:hypothetical protein
MYPNWVNLGCKPWVAQDHRLLDALNVVIRTTILLIADILAEYAFIASRVITNSQSALSDPNLELTARQPQLNLPPLLRYEK